jgi:hypothetical protein
MAESFTPVQTIEAFCRFCKRLTQMQLERSIPANGKTVDRGSTFEYYCARCNRPICMNGTDLAERGAAVAQAEGKVAKPKTRDYDPNYAYTIGEVVFHQTFKEEGTVIGKQPGEPPRMLVSFRKAGVRKLLEGNLSPTPPPTAPESSKAHKADAKVSKAEPKAGKKAAVLPAPKPAKAKKEKKPPAKPVPAAEAAKSKAAKPRAVKPKAPKPAGKAKPSRGKPARTSKPAPRPAARHGKKVAKKGAKR